MPAELLQTHCKTANINPFLTLVMCPGWSGAACDCLFCQLMGLCITSDGKSFRHTGIIRPTKKQYYPICRMVVGAVAFHVNGLSACESVHLCLCQIKVIKAIVSIKLHTKKTLPISLPCEVRGCKTLITLFWELNHSVWSGRATRATSLFQQRVKPEVSISTGKSL